MTSTLTAKDYEFSTKNLVVQGIEGADSSVEYLVHAMYTHHAWRAGIERHWYSAGMFIVPLTDSVYMYRVHVLSLTQLDMLHKGLCRACYLLLGAVPEHCHH